MYSSSRLASNRLAKEQVCLEPLAPLAPLHYHKLKITYFRKLNILPVLSPSEAEEMVDELSSKEQSPLVASSVASSCQLVIQSATKARAMDRHGGKSQRRSKSVKSFLASREPSAPIMIPSPPSQSESLGKRLYSLDAAELRLSYVPSSALDTDQEQSPAVSPVSADDEMFPLDLEL